MSNIANDIRTATAGARLKCWRRDNDCFPIAFGYPHYYGGDACPHCDSFRACSDSHREGLEEAYLPIIRQHSPTDVCTMLSSEEVGDE